MADKNLSAYGDKVVLLSKQIRSSSLNLSNIPYLIKQVIQENMWQQFLHPSAGQLVDNEAKTFRDFIVSQPPDGIGSDLKEIENILLVQTRSPHKDDADVAQEALELFIDKVAKDEGIMDLDTLPESLADKLKEQIDKKSKKASYELRRLKREYPELYQNVQQGELSEYQAAIQAGFRKRRFSLPEGDVMAAATTIKKKFSSDELSLLIKELENV